MWIFTLWLVTSAYTLQLDKQIEVQTQKECEALIEEVKVVGNFIASCMKK